jgi:hypothetical protein
MNRSKRSGQLSLAFPIQISSVDRAPDLLSLVPGHTLGSGLHPNSCPLLMNPTTLETEYVGGIGATTKCRQLHAINTSRLPLKSLGRERRRPQAQRYLPTPT